MLCKIKYRLVCFLFSVNVIVVLDQERLYNDFKKQFGDDIEVLHLPKSGGVRYTMLYTAELISCHQIT